MSTTPKDFYEAQFRADAYAALQDSRADTSGLQVFVETWGLKDKRVLEVGAGRGIYQDLVNNWYGIDLSLAASRHVRKPFVNASATALPFRDATFDAVWSVQVLEHVPCVERALDEIVRVLKPGGVAYLSPAWHCRPWAAQGIHVRPWSNLPWKYRGIRLTIPLRNSLVYRAALTLPLRAWREARQFIARGPRSFRYRPLTANYETFWCSDSDACNAMDPHEMLLWFLSRGFRSPSHPTLLNRFLVRHGAVVVEKHGRGGTLKGCGNEVKAV